MMTFNAAELAAMESGSFRLAIFWRLDVVPLPILLWLGIGNIAPGPNAYDVEGETYRGFGVLQNIPSFNQLINGKAARVEFTVSGVSGEVLRVAASGDPDQVRGKRAAVGLGIISADWQSLLGGVHWCATYIADFLALDQQATDNPQQPTVRSIRLSCGTMLTARRRPAFSYFTDQDQQARFPGDRFCERTPLYATGFNKAWPTFPPP